MLLLPLLLVVVVVVLLLLLTVAGVCDFRLGRSVACVGGMIVV